MVPDDVRFYCFEGGMAGTSVFDLQVHDADQRRWFNVQWLDRPLGVDLYDERLDELYEEVRDDSVALFKRHVDELPREVLQLSIDGAGTLTTSHVAAFDNNRFGPHYPSLPEFELSDMLPRTILRSELTEVDRLSSGVDIVSFEDTNKAVFKYSFSWKGFCLWEEIHILAQLPAHPNILPLDRLVLEEISGSRVVGYTMPFIDGGDLGRNWKSRHFKLKWAKQLMQVVDHLNLEYGIAHQDIAPRNMLIDATTDNLLLFDFGEAAQLGTEGEGSDALMTENPRRNDIKGVILALHEIITRDPSYVPSWLHLLDEAPVLDDPTRWVKHPDVVLDPGLTTRDYYDELVRWVRKRKGGVQVAHYTQAPKAFKCLGTLQRPPTGNRYLREQAIEHNLPFVEWARPRAVSLDKGRRLLATGKYADGDADADTEEKSEGKRLDGDGKDMGAGMKDDKDNEEGNHSGVGTSERKDDKEKGKDSHALAKRKRNVKADDEAVVPPHVQKPRRKSPRLAKEA